eukprot:TRINITY_DN1048_c0_g3_i1.p1 TRINITY_DN1048_c0_g3~~TRINITY_DN1048_c0_g3_i1.p1  ORF type:complete len:121 (+),score=20.05 TRINITY_DN1048_c0_g3_i1:129-491(+)
MEYIVNFFLAVLENLFDKTKDFSVVVRLSQTPKDLTKFDEASKEFKGYFQVHWNFSDSSEDLSPYEEKLKEGRHLLFVVDKARRGDTMPQSFGLYDIRASCGSKKSSLSSFLQDFGRAFG